VLDSVRPLVGIGGSGDQLQILDELPDRAAKLMAEDKAGKRATLPLPILRESLETNVLGEDDAAELTGVR
jgi:hypothetical protein